MKYVCLVYQPTSIGAKSLSEDEYKSVAAQYAALSGTPNSKPGLPFGYPNEAITVQVRDNKTVTTPGPYVEHPVGAYFEFEAESEAEVVELAARIPAVRLGGALEIRPSQKY